VHTGAHHNTGQYLPLQPGTDRPQRAQVSVVTVFKKLGARDDFFIMVFGENVLNDAVGIVLFQTINRFLEEDHVVSAVAILQGAARCTGHRAPACPAWHGVHLTLQLRMWVWPWVWVWASGARRARKW
jgi:hypothetical protein